jgi:uncharacterized protein YuzE
MAVRYSTHAAARIAARRPRAEWIEETVLNPDWTAADPEPTLARSCKAIAGQGRPGPQGRATAGRCGRSGGDGVFRQRGKAMMRTTYDPEADAFHARFVPDSTMVAETQEVAPGVTVDLDAAGNLVGIEVLSVTLRAAGRYGVPVPEAAAE